LLAAILAFAVSIPPAAKTLAVIAAVYGLVQGLKQIPALTPYVTGWIAVALNVLFTVCGALVVIPANQLYTTSTLLLLVTTFLSAAGVHGTVKSLSAPQVLAQTPPDGEVKKVPASLVPDDPANIAVDPHKEP
jgi:hypothetical protein